MRFIPFLLGALVCSFAAGCAADEADDADDLEGDVAGTEGEVGVVSAPITVCGNDCVYVRAGARGNGTTWSNALGALPTRLERGKVYFLAAGTYAGRVLGDAARGSTPITIKKATAADHGTNTGWSAALAGRATIGALEIRAPHYVIDGGQGRGLTVRGAFEGVVVDLKEGADNVTLRQLDIDGDFAKNGRNRHTRGACGAIHARSVSKLLIEWSDIHGAADDGIQLATVTDVTVRDNEIHHLAACGTDGENCVASCINGHSDGLEFSNVKRGTFSRNYMHHVTGTAAMFFTNQDRSPAQYVEDLVIVNNIFYAPDASAAAYVTQARGLKILNNVFWGKRRGAFGGLMLGRRVSDLDMHNNIILSINAQHMGFQFDARQHRIDHNLLAVDVGQVRKGARDKVGLPMFVGIPASLTAGILPNPTIRDFALQAGSPAINAGRTGNASLPIPTSDILRVARRGAPDIGVVER